VAEDVIDISDRGSAAYNKLPKHYQSALHDYTGSEYGLINSQLRTLPPEQWGQRTGAEQFWTAVCGIR
jgi:hypothetical protein